MAWFGSISFQSLLGLNSVLVLTDEVSCYITQKSIFYKNKSMIILYAVAYAGQRKPVFLYNNDLWYFSKKRTT